DSLQDCERAVSAPVMPETRVQDEQGNVHVFPDGSTPEMIAQALNVKPPTTDYAAMRPGMPAAPNAIISQELRTPRSPNCAGELPGSFEGHPENVGEYVPASAGNIAGGIKDIAQG